jgi:cytoskeletal protein RodZ
MTGLERDKHGAVRMIGRRFRTPTPEVDKPRGFDDYDMRLGDLMRGERATLGKSLLDVQRDLKIKASYIAAIENADVTAFETQGFIAGYVRSYARYLGMEPDATFARFCQEAGFEVAHGMSAAASTASMAAARNRAQAAENRDPFVHASFIPRAESMFAHVQPGAVGSLAVLVVLIAGLGYGGWSVLQEVQRVQLAPVNEAPAVVAEIDPLGNVDGDAPLVRSAPAVPEQVASAETGADRVYRPEALSVPVLTARDGPIAAINPNLTAPVTGVDAAAVEAAVASAITDDAAVQVVAAVAPGVEVVAVCPAWVRVSAADGTVLFEKILDAGERYTVPALQQAPVLRSGNSGSVFFAVNGVTYGPAAPGAQVVKNVSLDAASLTQAYAAADIALTREVNVADASGAAPLGCP